MNDHWNVERTIKTDERCWRFVSKMDAITIADECGQFVLFELFFQPAKAKRIGVSPLLRTESALFLFVHSQACGMDHSQACRIDRFCFLMRSCEGSQACRISHSQACGIGHSQLVGLVDLFSFFAEVCFFSSWAVPVQTL